MATKQEILDMLRAFVAQRPGMEPRDYGDFKAYRAQSREITRDLHDCRELLRVVEMRDGITADDLKEAFKHAFSGRLSLQDWKPCAAAPKGRLALDYCTGQYFPTEYRKAACAVLRSALWSYWRDDAEVARAPVARTYILRVAKNVLTPGVFRRWFREV